MKESTRFFAPLCAVMVVMLGVQWAGSAPVQTAASPAAESVSVAAFEYFPSKFLMDAAESGEHIPAF